MNLTLGKRLAALAAANLLGLALLFATGEAICRLARVPYRPTTVPRENAIARYDAELGWSYRPGFSATIRTPFNTHEVDFDENGIRVPRRGHRLDGERPSVLFVGCSYTMGHGLPYEESFVGQFAAAAGADYQTVNLGVQAYGTDQAYLALLRHLPRFNARVVVYTFLGDHVIRNGNYDRRMLYPNAVFLGTKPLFDLDPRGRLVLARKPARYEQLHTSYLLDLLRIRLGTLMGTFPPAPLALTRALVREMAAAARERGARFVVVNWRWSEADRSDRDLEDLGAEVIDTLDDAPPGWAAMRLPGDEHPDRAAGRHVAELLRRRLLEPVPGASAPTAPP
jgi:hypothetical protein